MLVGRGCHLDPARNNTRVVKLSGISRGFPAVCFAVGGKIGGACGPPLMTRSGSESWTRKGIQLQTTLAVVTSRIHSGLLGTEWLACSSCEGGFDIGDLLHETKTARDAPESKLLVEVGNSLGERIDDD